MATIQREVFQKVQSGQITTGSPTPKTTLKTTESSTENVPVNVIETSSSLAQHFHVNERTIHRDLKTLQSKGINRRVGPDKCGYWEIINDNE